jgi:gluconate:H+ symporter, GntP family
MLYTTFLLLAAIAAIVLLSARYKFNVFFVLLAVSAATGVAAGLGGEAIIGHLKAGIGHTIEKIGLLIILGITLGILLEKSGATTSLANAVLRRTGEANTPLAMCIVGYVVGLPIFCDSGFVVLSGLALSLSAQSPGRHLWIVLALASGLYAVHCLVPPHPGITAAAGTLQADVGLVMLLGAVAAIPTAAAGFFMGKWFNQRFQIVYAPKHHTAAADPEHLPGALLSLLPVMTPVLLIGVKSVLGLYPTLTAAGWWPVVRLAGDPVMALLAGIALCFPLFKKLTRAQFNHILESSLTKSGGILLIIAAGGAFGEIIKALDLGKVFGPALAGSGLGLLVPFLLTMVFKIAQGSSTVAVISAAGILAPLLPALGFDTDTTRALALLAMGAGSIAISHTNDAYFWVVSKFSDIDTETALQSYTIMTAVMGLTALAAIWALWLFA